MDISRILSGKCQLSYSSHLDKESNDSLYKIVAKIINDYIEDCDIEFIFSISENENFDTYEVSVKNQSKKFIVKISYDISCYEILNETAILKNQKPIFCNSHVGSGIYKSQGISFLYLISTKENAINLSELGRANFFNHKDSFLFTLGNFSNLKSSKSLEDHLNHILKPSIFYEDESFLEEFENAEKNGDINAKNISQWSRSDIEKNTDFHVFVLMRSFKNFIFGLYDKEFFDKGETCHGSLNNDKIIFKNGLFKFTDVGSHFSGNSMFDLCWLCLEMGCKKSDFESALKTYA